MDSKMHPALRAVAEEWIQQELQGVQSPASILYFLPFGRTLIFISDNRWVSVSNNEHRWVGKMKCCIFALWFRKSLPQISQICTDSLRCKQRYSLRLTAKTPRGVKNLWKSVRSVGKQKLREEKNSFDCISPLQRPHYFTSSYTYLFSKKVILLSFLGWRIA